MGGLGCVSFIGAHRAARCVARPCWDGTVCKDPVRKASCTLLSHVGPNREDSVEVGLAGNGMLDSRSYVPPCINERATFMAPKAWASSSPIRSAKIRRSKHLVRLTFRPRRWKPAPEGRSPPLLVLPAALGHCD